MFLYRLIQLLGLITLTQSFDYSLDSSSSSSATDVRLKLIDESTGISNLKTLFIGEVTNVTVQGISWIPNEHTITALQYQGNESYHHHPSVIQWTTYVDGIIVDNGTIPLMGIGRQLPKQISVGSFQVQERGIHTLTVQLVVDDSVLIVSEQYNAYHMMISILPLFVTLLLSVTTNMVRENPFKNTEKQKGYKKITAFVWVYDIF
jgi:hypothetical protein